MYAARGLRVPALLRSTHRFRFGDVTYNSLGKVALPLSTPPGIPTIKVMMDVVPPDIPALMGMDVLDQESLTPDTVENRLVKKIPVKKQDGTFQYMEQWHVPMYRSKSNHLYVDMDFPISMRYTKSQLSKPHKNFFHPAADKLFNLLRKSKPEEATPETLDALKDITKRCYPCQRVHNAPPRFRVSFGAENVRFNERILIDIMYIGAKPVMHIVDEGTRFSAARFLNEVSTIAIWQAITEFCVCIYTGLPNKMLTDQGRAFGDLFIAMGRLQDVEVERTGIEAHSSLGVGERYHQPLRNTFRMP